MPYRANYIPVIPELKKNLRDRQSHWMLWKKDRNSGTYSCSQCARVAYCAGERYDLMVCWDCMFPELVGQSPLDLRKRAREAAKRRGEDRVQQVHRYPTDPPKQRKS